MAEAWRRAAGVSVDVLPLADGRSGTAEALSGVRDVVVLSDATLVAPGTDRADAVLNGSSRPLGTLLASALTTDARTVLVALGADAGTGTAWADGGAGVLVGLADGLGVPVPDSSRLVAGGAALRGVTADDLPDLGALRRALAGRDVRVAHRAPDALLGLGGLAGGLVPDVLDAAAAQDLERALSDLVHAIAGARAGTLVGRDLLGAASSSSSTTSARAISDHARELGALRGGAAGGGAALALAALGVPLAPAAPLVADLVGVASVVAQADLVVVVVPVLDGDESHDGVLPAVADAALDAAVPVVVLAGTSLSGRREWSALGVAAVHETGWAVPDDVLGADGAVQDCAVQDCAAERVARIARTWRL